MYFQNNIRYVVLMLLLSISVLSFARKPINYEHKSIHKTISKYYKSKAFSLSELPELEKEIPQGKFFSVTLDNSDTGFVYVGRVDCCRAGGCSNTAVTYDGNAEYFDFIVIFNATGTVENIKVYSYMATHGHEVTARGWLKQFYGYNGNYSLRVGKEIDAISGATISVNSLTACVEYITAEIAKHVN